MLKKMSHEEKRKWRDYRAGITRPASCVSGLREQEMLTELGMATCSCQKLFTSDEYGPEWSVTDAGFVFSPDMVTLTLHSPHGDFHVDLYDGEVDGEQHIDSNLVRMDSRLDLFTAQTRHPESESLKMAAEIWSYLQPHMKHRWTLHNSSPIWTLEANRIS